MDEETTILSQRGWLSYKEITTNDIVLSIDPITQQLIWSTIHDLYIGTYNGLMFKLDGSTIDALVTTFRNSGVFVDPSAKIDPVVDNTPKVSNK